MTDMTTKAIVNAYYKDCAEIAAQCEEEGCSSNGSTYEIRTEDLWKTYYEDDYHKAYRHEKRVAARIKTAKIHSNKRHHRNTTSPWSVKWMVVA